MQSPRGVSIQGCAWSASTVVFNTRIGLLIQAHQVLALSLCRSAVAALALWTLILSVSAQWLGATAADQSSSFKNWADLAINIRPLLTESATIDLAGLDWKTKGENGQWGSIMNHQPQKHDRLTDRERIRIHAQTKHEQLKAEAIDILIDVLHNAWWRNGIVWSQSG
jgi:hypothetical protein